MWLKYSIKIIFGIFLIVLYCLFAILKLPVVFIINVFDKCIHDLN